MPQSLRQWVQSRIENAAAKKERTPCSEKLNAVFLGLFSSVVIETSCHTLVFQQNAAWFPPSSTGPFYAFF